MSLTSSSLRLFWKSGFQNLAGACAESKPRGVIGLPRFLRESIFGSSTLPLLKASTVLSFTTVAFAASCAPSISSSQQMARCVGRTRMNLSRMRPNPWCSRRARSCARLTKKVSAQNPMELHEQLKLVAQSTILSVAKMVGKITLLRNFLKPLCRGQNPQI